jgi:hypothetical protein
MRLDTVALGVTAVSQLQFVSNGQLTQYTIIGPLVCHQSAPVPIPPLLNNTLPGLDCTTPRYLGTHLGARFSVYFSFQRDILLASWNVCLRNAGTNNGISSWFLQCTGPVVTGGAANVTMSWRGQQPVQMIMASSAATAVMQVKQYGSWLCYPFIIVCEHVFGSYSTALCLCPLGSLANTLCRSKAGKLGPFLPECSRFVTRFEYGACLSSQSTLQLPTACNLARREPATAAAEEAIAAGFGAVLRAIEQMA